MNKFVNAEDVKDLLNGLDSLPWEDEVEDMVDCLIVADVAEVKHGRWINCKWEDGDYKEQCSRCHEWSGEYYRVFCSSCGAKMDGDDNVI